MNNQGNLNGSNQIKRGDIWFVDFGMGNGRVQGNRRPGVVISNNTCNANSPVVTVVALTSNVEKALAKQLPTQVFVSKNCGLQSDSIALCEQPRSIDKSQLDFKVGEVDVDTMILIERALMVQVGIKPTNNNIVNNQIITIKFDMNYAKELIININQLDKLQKELGKTIPAKQLILKQFVKYCTDANMDYKVVADQIKNEINSMNKIKAENRELVLV